MSEKKKGLEKAKKLEENEPLDSTQLKKDDEEFKKLAKKAAKMIDGGKKRL